MVDVKVCQRNHTRPAHLIRCPDCTKERNKRDARKRRESQEYRARQSEYQKEYRERTREQRKKYLEDNKEARARSVRNAFLKRKYGITQEDFELMLQDQDGRCKICGEPPTLENTKHGVLAVDHCHYTGKVRGLLCDLCNKGVGLLKDDVDRLKNAIKYLEEATE